MNKTFRFLAFAIAIALIAVAAVPSAQAAQTVNLVLMGWSSSPSENERLQKIVDDWNAANPDIQVTLNQVPDYDTTLQKSLAGGEPPDVFYVDSFRFLDLVRADALMPIGDKLTDIEDFYPALRNAFTANGQFYCPPKDFSTLALQINTEMFEAAGLSAPTTWEEMRAAAEKLTKDGVYGVVVPADFARWIAFLYGAGGSVTDDEFTKMTINSPEAAEALKFYTDLYIDGFAKTPADLGVGWAGEAFGKGLVAMAFEGNWIEPYLKDQFPDLKHKAVELPAGPAGKATMAFTVCYAVPMKAKNPDAAIKFVDYLTGAQGMKAWTDLGLAMPTRASLRQGWLEKFPNLEPYLNGAEYARKWQFVPGFQAVLDKVNEQLSLVMSENQTVSGALAEIERVGNEVLASR
ncbi:MAG: ABC transporter substrate-binding protein [Candidatus Thermofonsia Clade 1 bacterium]|jgi:multiple sugar transport system substrate-binding protein|uniref:ABC transporter substrate-binding protein n=1 Tax=Candidatus Thermofonsia Clade 1 bacterium TaxID=2364210 RepID=A0A2M8PGU0_9CHLR|nr:MAG: ABC transporter substrate-binding protein [Candidatus Thermofonsia Clade 1 bacterium]RMF50027.1 MAG: ABC transporter substrate-binding protein [Chloroflexota bacterium]